MTTLHEWIEAAAMCIEVMAVAIMVGLVVFGTAKWLFFSGRRVEKAYERYRMHLGKALLVGIEILVAADIIRTVILETTLLNILTLGALVLVRTFLGWTLTVEVEGCWPWQKRGAAGPDAGEGIAATRLQGKAGLAGVTSAEVERRQ